MVSAALTLALTFGSGAVVPDAGVRSEARLLVQGVATRRAPELTVEPWFRLLHHEGSTDATLSYEPRFSVPAATNDFVDHYHRIAGVLTHRVPRNVFGLRFNAGYGFVTIDPLRTLPTMDSPSDLPGETQILQGIHYMSGDLNASLASELGRRWQMTTRLGWRASGDATVGEVSDTVPFSHGPDVELSTRHDVTRRDIWISRLGVTATLFEGGERGATGELTTGWRRSLTERLSAEAGAGVGAFSQTVEEGAPPMPGAIAGWDPTGNFGPLVLAPVGLLAVEYRALSLRPWDLRVAATVAPFTDFLSTETYLRSALWVTGSWRVQERVLLRGMIGVGSPLGSAIELAAGTARAEAGAAFALRPGMELTAGVRWAFERSLVVAERPRADWATFVGFSYAVRGSHEAR